ncbi:MAG: hypothetical protein ACRDJN_05325, partial [Chloroflexota bacterium]
TAPGGCFLNLDMVGTASSLLPEVWRHARVEQARRRRLAETGVLPTYDELEAEMRAQRPARHAGHAESAASQAGQPVATTAEAERAAASDGRGGEPDARTSGGISRSLLDHLLWLHQAGFDAVECFWRQENRALIGGHVQPSPLPLGEG